MLLVCWRLVGEFASAARFRGAVQLSLARPLGAGGLKTPGEVSGKAQSSLEDAPQPRFDETPGDPVPAQIPAEQAAPRGLFLASLGVITCP